MVFALSLRFLLRVRHYSERPRLRKPSAFGKFKSRQCVGHRSHAQSADLKAASYLSIIYHDCWSQVSLLRLKSSTQTFARTFTHTDKNITPLILWFFLLLFITITVSLKISHGLSGWNRTMSPSNIQHYSDTSIFAFSCAIRMLSQYFIARFDLERTR